jgi:hypothetical protein
MRVMMNKLNNIMLAVVILLFSSVAIAQDASLTVSSDSGAPNDTVSVTVTWSPGVADPSQYKSLEFEVDFDQTRLTFDGCTFNAPYNAYSSQLCADVGTPGTVDILLINAPPASPAQPIPGGILGTMNFTIKSDATPAVTDAELINVVLANDATLNNGTITVTAGPQPDADFSPDSGTLNLGSVFQNGTDPTQNVTVENVGATGSSLDAACSITDNATVFSVSPASIDAMVPTDGPSFFVVSCDASQAIQAHAGELTCTHTGDGTTDASPVVIDLACNITAGPQPAYTSNPVAGQPIEFTPTETGDPNVFTNLAVTNTGDVGTLLDVTCTWQGGSDPEIYFTTNGVRNDIAQNATVQIELGCATSTNPAPGDYDAVLSCAHNGSNTSPVTYAVGCTVLEAGSAIFRSSPVPGPIDVASGADVVVDDTDPTRQLTFFNDAADGDQYMDISCDLVGDAEITVAPTPFSTSIAPGGNSAVTFSCATDSSGSFDATYTCNYSNGGVDGPDGDESGIEVLYAVSCDVREAEAEITVSPASNTPQSKSVPPNGSTSFNFSFTEINDEGAEGGLTCSLGGGQGFSITSPVLPTTVSSGETVTVVVGFTDPTGAESWSDTLTCQYTDSNDDPATVSWPLTVNIGGDARFTVLKDFTDGNPGDVTVELDCNTGLILDQDKVISEDGIGVTFVVTDYTAGNLACNVKEAPLAGYTADYEASGDSDASNSVDGVPGCYWTDIAGGVDNLCVITNTPDAVDVVINKEWLYPGSATALDISDEFELVLICLLAEIEGGQNLDDGGDETLDAPSGISSNFCGLATSSVESAQLLNPSDVWCKNLYGSGDTTFTEEVIPYSYPGGACLVIEVNVDQAVEVDNGCDDGSLETLALQVSAGQGASCTITNTVFFEGIPTLSEYGMALMALLMLGLGFVAVRRIA